MPAMSVSDFEALVLVEAKTLGLVVEKVSTSPHDLGNGLANTDLIVNRGPKVYQLAEKLATALSRSLGSKVRAGYYEREEGETDIPPGKAMIQLDLHILDFKPAPQAVKSATPAP